MVAVVTGQLDLVSMLLDAGADIEATNDVRAAPLDLLCMRSGMQTKSLPS